MKKLTCDVCGTLIENKNISMTNAPIVIKVKYPKVEEFEVCSEDCGILFFKKRKIDLKASEELKKITEEN